MADPDREAFIPADPAAPGVLIPTDGPAAYVLRVPPGSVLVLRGVDWADTEGEADALLALREAIGHNRFAVLNLPTGAEATVLDPSALLRLVADAVDAGSDWPDVESVSPPRNPTPPVGAGLPLRRVTDSPQA